MTVLFLNAGITATGVSVLRGRPSDWQWVRICAAYCRTAAYVRAMRARALLALRTQVLGVNLLGVQHGVHHFWRVPRRRRGTNTFLAALRVAANSASLCVRIYTRVWKHTRHALGWGASDPT